MGREWYLNWGTKSSSKKGRTNNKGGGGGIGRKSSTPPPVAAAAAAATAGGCMNAVLHMFDFQLCLHPQDSSFLPDDHTSLKGIIHYNFLKLFIFIVRRNLDYCASYLITNFIKPRTL